MIDPDDSYDMAGPIETPEGRRAPGRTSRRRWWCRWHGRSRAPAPVAHEPVNGAGHPAAGQSPAEAAEEAPVKRSRPRRRQKAEAPDGRAGAAAGVVESQPRAGDEPAEAAEGFERHLLGAVGRRDAGRRRAGPRRRGRAAARLARSILRRWPKARATTRDSVAASAGKRGASSRSICTTALVDLGRRGEGLRRDLEDDSGRRCATGRGSPAGRRPWSPGGRRCARRPPSGTSASGWSRTAARPAGVSQRTRSSVPTL